MHVSKKRKNHWTVMVVNVFKTFYQIFFIMLIAVVKMDNFYLELLVIPFAIISILKWYKTLFYIKDDMLVLEKGILNKEKQEIPLNKIVTVDMEQNLFQRIFKICKLKVDSGAVDLESEFKIILKKDLAEIFKKELLKEKNEDNNIANFSDDHDKKEIKNQFFNQKVISNKELVIYALTKNKLGWLFGAFVIIDKIKNFFKDQIETIGNKINHSAEGVQNSINSKSNMYLILMIVGIIIVIYIICVLITILLENIRFSGFTITKSDSKIKLEYGLITKKNYSFKEENIQAIKFKQSIIQQFMGLYTIEGVILGYGDKDDKKAILYPIVNEKTKEEFIEEFFSDFHGKYYLNKPTLNNLRRFILKRTFIIILVTGIIVKLLYFIPDIIKISIIAVLGVSQIILGYLNYKNTTLGISKNNLSLSSGAITKTTHLIKQNSVQSIKQIQNPFQRLSKVCNFSVDICTNIFGEVVTVKHLDEDLICKLENNIEF